MKPQEIFDTVAKHLIQQGCRATVSAGSRPDSDGLCQYRGPNGTKCAVGALIPDDVYDAKMEGDTVTGLLVSFGSVLPSWMGPNLGLLRDLQMVHDHPETWEEPTTLRKELFKVSRDHGLSPAVLHA